MAPAILTVTLNPALDITTTTERLHPQHKLRCVAPRYDPGGGGVNVSRAIKELGGESLAFVGVAGGTGGQIQRLLERQGLDCEFWPLEGETRFSLTVMESATALHYRFVLPGPEQSAAAAESIIERMSELISSGVRYVVGSGSLPPGIPDDFYGRLAEVARAGGARLLLDTQGAALRAALPHRPYMIRLNHLEAQELIGSESQTTAPQLARELVDSGAADLAIVTVGENGATVASADTDLHVISPRVPVRSAVGAGDSFMGALTLGLARGWPLDQATRYGVAAAASTVTTQATELCHAEQVNGFFSEIGGDAALLRQPATA